MKSYRLSYVEAKIAQAEYHKKYSNDIRKYDLLNVRYAKMGVNRTECKALLRSCRLAIALKIYKSQKSNYPKSLNELCPTIIEKLPKDPFNEKDFIYKQKGADVIIYSVGNNLKDDGGEKDDIVW